MAWILLSFQEDVRRTSTSPSGAVTVLYYYKLYCTCELYYYCRINLYYYDLVFILLYYYSIRMACAARLYYYMNKALCVKELHVVITVKWLVQQVHVVSEVMLGLLVESVSRGVNQSFLLFWSVRG